MKAIMLRALCFCVLLSPTLLGQNPISISQSNVTLPRIMRFSGVLPEGKSEVAGVTFAFYKDETGGTPLWQETQTVRPDASGKFSVLLGSTQPDGLPADLFSSTEARWLGVIVEGGEEQARMQLVSVPYALKAGDAETLGGQPLSSFVLNETASKGETSGTATAAVAPASRPIRTAADIAGSSGTTNYVAKWTNPTTLGSSLLFDNGTYVGVATNNPKATLDVNGEAIFRSPLTIFTTTYSFGPQFAFNNSALPTPARWALGVPGYANATSFFLFDSVNSYAPFTIEQGSGKDALYVSGGNVGIGTNTPASKLTVNGDIAAFGAAAFGTVKSSVVNASNNYLIDGTQVLTQSVPSGNLFLGQDAGAADQTISPVIGANNTFLGMQAGPANAVGGENVFVGYQSGLINFSGNFNTFIGWRSGFSNGKDTGVNPLSGINNTYIGARTGYYNDGSSNIYLGANTGFDSTITTESNTMRLGSTATGGITKTYIAGISGVQVSNGVGVVVDSKGHVGVAASSSRRFKESVLPMGDATEALFKLHPVTFYYKRDFDPNSPRLLQYGLIAEELAEVYPELVTYDEQGQPNAIKYQYFAPMLLNEVQKQYRRAEAEAIVITRQEEKIDRLQKQNDEIQQRLERLETQLARAQK